MYKFLCVLAVISLVSAQSTSSNAAYRLTSFKVDVDSVESTAFGANTPRVNANEEFVYTVKGYNLITGDRIAWVFNTEYDCYNAGSTTVGTVGVPAVKLTCGAADATTKVVTCTGKSTFVAPNGLDTTKYNNPLRLCYSRGAFDPYGNAATVNFPWQYYGNLFKFGVVLFKSWKDSADSFEYTSATAQRFWADQTLGSGTNGGTLSLFGSSLRTGDYLAIVPASGAGVGTTCSSATFAPTCTTAGGCTTLTVVDAASSKFAQDVKIPAEGTHFLCFRRSTTTNTVVTRFDTALRSQSRTFTAGNALQFVFPTHVIPDTANKKMATGQVFRIGMWAVRGSDKFGFAETSSTYADCAAVKANGAVFKVTELNQVTPAPSNSPIRNAKITLDVSGAIRATAFAANFITQVYICYYPDGDGTAVAPAAVGQGTPKTAPWIVDNCVFNNKGASINTPATGIPYLMANDFSYGVQAILFAKQQQTVFWAGCPASTTSKPVGVFDGTCVGTTTGDGLKTISDDTWPLIDIKPTITATANGVTNLCYNNAQVTGKDAVPADVAMVYEVFISDATNGITKLASGAAALTPSVIYTKPAALSTATNDKSVNWFMAGWAPFLGGTSTLGSALNYWSGDGTNNKYGKGDQTHGSGLKTHIILANLAAADSDMSCGVLAVNAVRYGSATATGGASDSSGDGLLAKSFVRTATSLECTYAATATTADVQSCILGSFTTPDVTKDTVLTMCVRVSDGTTGPSSWVKTDIKITQFPKLFYFPDNVALGVATNTQKFFFAGLVAGETAKAGLIKPTAGAGLVGTATATATARCLDTFTQGTITVANNAGTTSMPIGGAGQLATPTVAATGYIFCLSRSANGNGSAEKYLYAKLSAATSVVTVGVLDTSTVVSPGKYWITDKDGVYQDFTTPTVVGSKDEVDFMLTTIGVSLKAELSRAAPMLSDAVTTAYVVKDLASCIATPLTANVAGSGPVSYTNAWTVPDNNVPFETQKATAEVTVAAAATVFFNSGVLCYNTQSHTNAAKKGIRVLKVQDTCASAACPTTPAGSTAIKVVDLGNYVVTGDLSKDIFFDLKGINSGDTTDKAAFALVSGAADMTGTTATLPTATADSGKLTGYAVGIFQTTGSAAPATGVSGDPGVFNLWILPARTPFKYNTGKTLTVVKITDRYPGSYIATETNTVYFAWSYGLTGGSAYLTSDATCALTFAADATKTTATAPSVTVSSTGLASLTVTPPGTAPGADIAFVTLCYSKGTTNYVKALTITTLTAGKDIAAISADLPVVTTGVISNQVSTFETTPLQFTVNTATSKGFIQDDYKPLITTDAGCAGGTGATAFAATSVAKAADTKTANTGHTVTIPGLPLGQTSWKICWPKKKSPSAAADWGFSLATSVIVKNKPTAGNWFVVTTAEPTSEQEFTLTYTSTVAGEKLGADDALCIVPAGMAGPSTAGAVTLNAGAGGNSYRVYTYDDPTSTATVKPTITIYCLAINADKVNFKNIMGALPVTAATHNTKFDIWAVAGAKAGSLATPVKITGSVTLLVPDFRPYSAYISGTRIFYTQAFNDKFDVATGIDKCASTATYPSTASSTGSFSLALTGDAAQYFCYNPAAASTVKVSFRNTGLNNIVVKAFDQASDDLFKGPTVLPPPATGSTSRYMRFHANVDTTLYFRYATSYAQEKDVFKVIKYESANPATGTAKECDGTNAAAAADFLPDNTATGAWASTVDTSSSVWVKIAKIAPITTLTSCAGCFHLLPLCWTQFGTTSPRKIPGTTGVMIRLVDVDNFRVSTAASNALVPPVNAPEPFPGAPRAIAAFTGARVFLSGHWLEGDDFAAFVAKGSTDCSNAWFTENAVYYSDTAAISVTSAIDKFRILLEGGLPGGVFNLCFFAQNTHTGYRLYDNIVALRSFDVTISPMTASSGVATSFTITTYKDSDVNPGIFSGNDQLGFGPNTGATACSGVNVTNVTVNAQGAGVASATLTTTKTSEVFTACAAFYAGLSAQNLACVYGDCNAGATVTVYTTSTVSSILPATVARGIPTDITFVGAFLNKNGQADSVILSPTNVCANNGTFQTLGIVGTEGNQALWKSYSQNVPGLYYACYAYSQNATTPVGFDTTKVSLVVAGIDKIEPTGQDATTFASNGQTITLTGVFNLAQSVGKWDYDYVGLVPRVAKRRDCSGLNLANAFANPVKLTGSGATATTGTVDIDSTDASTNADYSLCVHFAGMAWSATPSDKDFVLIDQSKVTFSRRSISDFSPRTIVNGTASTVNLFGFGLNDTDSVAAVAPTFDCTTTAPSNPVTVIGNKASFNLPAGSYRLCYKFTQSTKWFPVLDDTARLVAKDASVDTLEVRVKGNTVAAKSWDIADSARLVLSGTGLSGQDKARLVNNTANANCDATDRWVPLTPDNGPASAKYFFDVPALFGNGSYILCYMWANGNKKLYNTTEFQTKITVGPRALGIAPRMIDLSANGTTVFAILGQQLSSTDKAALVPVSQAGCPASGTTQVSSVAGPPGRNIAQISIPITGASAGGVFRLCYYPASTPAAPSIIENAVWVNDPTAVCPVGKKYRCGASCQDKPCVPIAQDACIGNPLGVVCPGTAFCASSPAECLTVASSIALPSCSASKPQRCFDGSCAMNMFLCPPVSPPPAGAARCVDSTNAALGACQVTSFKCTGISTNNGICTAAGGCPVAGSTDLNQCPPADGCPPGNFRCSDCTCQPDCGTRSFPRFLCADGSTGTSATDCPKCWRHAKIAQQIISTSKNPRRRFVVRASAKIDATPVFSAANDVLVNIAADEDLANDNGCSIALSPVADSVVDQAAATDGFLAGPTILIAVLTNTSTPCALNPAKYITLTFPNLETATVDFAAYINPTSNSTIKVEKLSANSVRISGSTIVAGIAPFYGTKINTVIVPSATASTPTPTPGTPTPGGGTPTPGGTGTPTPTGPASSSSTTPTSSATGVSFSAVVVAVVLSLLAMLI